MFPIRGSFGGPGGNLEFVELKIKINIMNKKMKNKKMGDEIILG